MNNKTNLKIRWIISVVLLTLWPAVAGGDIIYVRASASVGGSGQTWGTAYKYLQDALYKPPTGGDEIWVAAGTYKPDADEGGNVTPNDRSETFQLINGVGIYGGFAGTETTLDERDWQTNETILSGDINTPDVNTDNSYHVVTGSGTDANAILDGFTITGGNANGVSSPHYYGGGMYNSAGSPTVTNCTFIGNSAEYGGGMLNYQSTPTVTNCTFIGNSAEYAGGMFNFQNTPTVTNCTFSGNSATNGGGGMYNDYSDPNITNCILWGNTASSGAQIYNYTSSPTVTYCDVEGGYPGTGNIGDDPCFVDADGPDNIVGTEDDNLRLLAASACIDVGDNSAIPADSADLDGDGNTIEPIPFDLDGNPRIVNGTVDMGAYEYLVCELTVSSTSGGIVSQPGQGVFEYAYGTVLPIVAEADPCYVFVEWTGTAVDAGKVFGQYEATTTVTVDGDYTLMANFRESDYDPDQAWNPSPLDTEMLVYPYVTLSWMPGDRIGSKSRHLVYFGTDYTAMENSPAAGEPGFPGPEYQGFNFWNDLDWLIGELECSKSYYWRIDEGNEDGSLTKGNVWGFTTGAHIYVDESAMGGNDGTSWDDAYNYLQDALADPCLAYGDQIWVAEGVYKPDESNAVPDGTGLRTDTFALISGVAIYGGFASGGTWAERDPNEYETVLSGDLDGDDEPNFVNNNENSYHVVTSSGTDAWAVMDGFTITAGNANGSNPYDRGGGMYNDSGSPTVTSCTFSGNSAGSVGGGMCNRNGSDPTLTNCTFTGNGTSGAGGGMYNDSSSPTLTNCIFTGNSADFSGGGMQNWDSSSPTVTNCTFSGNAADNGGGMRNVNSSPMVTNCILWGNTAPSGAQIYDDGTSSPTVTYCDVEGGYPGTGNIGDDPNDDPLFRDADGEDDIVGTEDDDLRISAYSPCIDAGDNNSVPADTADLDRDGNTAEPIPFDLDGNARFFDDPVTDDTGSGTAPIVDMGAYEFQDVCGDAEHPYPAGDLNHDCYVDFYDFAIFCLSWLECTAPECD